MSEIVSQLTSIFLLKPASEHTWSAAMIILMLSKLTTIARSLMKSAVGYGVGMRGSTMRKSLQEKEGRPGVAPAFLTDLLVTLLACNKCQAWR